ncbi:MAG: nucleoside hydrolase [Promicromonosporaceae bacterium]|nr:nucleoside hydrolase [Promicromonosporaceae bacterium]
MIDPSTPGAGASPVPVILDGDPGHDDAIAWVLALAAPTLEVLGITTVGGNAPLEKTTYNTLRILTLLDRTDVPVAAGASRPLVAEPIVAPSVHGESGLDGPELPEPAVQAVQETAVELMARLLRSASRPVWLVPTGALTNVAALLLAHPELHARIAGISLMGGGIQRGNWTPAAEFNILVDPEAAKIVFESGLPLKMAGLDVTERAQFLPEDFEAVRAVGGPFAEVVADWLHFFYEFHHALGYAGAPVHDPVAVVALIAPEILQTQEMFVQVETAGQYARGATIGDVYGSTGRAPNAEVAMGIDREAYVELIVTAVRRHSERLAGGKR